MKILFFFIVFINLLTACSPSAPANPWDGEYLYRGYRSNITISINNPDLKQACVFQDIGVRINENFICSATTKGDTLEVSFKMERFGEVGGTNKVGDVLFSLEKPKDHMKRYPVRWGSYVPIDDMKKTDKFFEKIK